MEGVRSHHASEAGSCLYCDVVAKERKARQRIVAEDERFVALAPYAARFPFETWILRKDHASAFESIPDSYRLLLARFLKDTWGRMDQILEDPSFNCYIHTAPRGDDGVSYHLHLEITPHLMKTAGFERGSGFYINPVVPEDAAAILRGEVRWSEQAH